MITLVVYGTPAPKGSARAMLIAGKARLVAGSSNANNTAQSRWSRAVRAQALDQPERYEDTPLEVTIEFRMPRPAGHRGTGRNADKLKPHAPPMPSTKPDIDKLTRCTLDALVGTVSRGRMHYGIIDDDARIVVINARKVYAEQSVQVGATITIGPAA